MTFQIFAAIIKVRNSVSENRNTAVRTGPLDGAIRGGRKPMATKVRDYRKLAQDIKNTIGERNIQSATHCATRLRLVLKNSLDASIIK